MKIETHNHIEAIVTVRTVGPDGRDRQRLRFRNLILDVGLDNLVQKSAVNCSTYCAVGTGNSTPVVSQTALDTELARTSRLVAASTSSGNSGSSPWYWYYIREWEFTPGEATGILAELGFSDNSIFFSRALIKDGVGSPTTITVLSTEYLYVTYEIRHYPADESDQTGTHTISSVGYAYTLRPANIDNANSFWELDSLWPGGGTALCFETDTLGVITDGPAGTGVDASAVENSTYSAGNFYLDTTFTWTPTVANFATGIGSVLFGGVFQSWCGWQVAYDTTKIPKDATKTLTVTYRQSWGRKP